MSVIKKIILTSALVVVAIPVSASAQKFFVSGAEVMNLASFGVKGSGVIIQINFKVPRAAEVVQMMIICDKSVLTADLEKAGESVGKIEKIENNCKLIEINAGNLFNPPGCTVKEPFALKFKGKLFVSPMSGEVEDTLTGEVGAEEFGEVKVEGGACVFRGSYILKGKETCEIVLGMREFDKHDLQCLATASAITVGGRPAAIRNVPEVKVEGNNTWSVR